MNKQSRFAIAAVLMLGMAQLVFATALDDYVAKRDPSYKYTLAKTIEGAGVTAYILDMTSQT